MNNLEGLAYGIMQGLTEFLPVSSSGHLFLLKSLFNDQDIPVLFDILLHIASLFAVILFLHKDLAKMAYSVIFYYPHKIKRTLKREEIEYFNIFINMLISTLVTFIFYELIIKRIPINKITVSSFFLINALMLYSTRFFKKNKIREIYFLSALIIGLFQGFGILPGISRSGSCITAGIICLVNKETVGKYAFILSIPAILGGFLLDIDQYNSLIQISIGSIILGMISSFIIGLVCLNFLFFIINTGKIYYFSIYSIIISILGFLNVW